MYKSQCLVQDSSGCVQYPGEAMAPKQQQLVRLVHPVCSPVFKHICHWMLFERRASGPRIW
jgi:hypothetical protein